MKGKSRLYKRDLITTQEWSYDELIETIELAEEMQEKRFSPEFSNLLFNRSFFMFFFSALCQKVLF